MSKNTMQNYDEWKQYGIEHGFDKRNPASLSRSKNKTERSWYVKSMKEKWIKNFEFKRLRFHNLFRNCKKWREFGLKNNYNERNPSSLAESKNKTERSWYYKGIKEEWIKDFEFRRKHVKDGYWKEWENVKGELNRIKKRLGHFPSSDELNELGYSGLRSALVSYYKGYNKVREKMGFKLSRKQKGYWSNWENMKKTLNEIIKKNGKFPTSTELREVGYSGLLTSIIETHGGLCKVRERLGYKEGKRQQGYWKDFNKIRKEIEEIISKTGKFPNQRDLFKIGKSALNSVITVHHGGLNNVRKMMGYGEGRKSNSYIKKYWQKWDNLERELKEIIEKNKVNFLTLDYLIKIERSDITNAIGKYHGGIRAVRSRLGYGNDRENSQLESFLENYVSGGGKDE